MAHYRAKLDALPNTKARDRIIKTPVPGASTYTQYTKNNAAKPYSGGLPV